MRITFLGTGGSTGLPILSCPCQVCQSLHEKDKRLRTSIHIEVAGRSFVIDCGPDFRQQALRANINKVDAIIFTHGHKDHTGGIDDTKPLSYLQQKPLPLCHHKVLL